MKTIICDACGDDITDEAYNHKATYMGHKVDVCHECTERNGGLRDIENKANDAHCKVTSELMPKFLSSECVKRINAAVKWDRDHQGIDNG